MQKIQKFQLGRIYSAPKSTKTYELLSRDGHRLAFLVRNPKTRDSWKQISTSSFKADESGAFEEILFSEVSASVPMPSARKKYLSRTGRDSWNGWLPWRRKYRNDV